MQKIRSRRKHKEHIVLVMCGNGTNEAKDKLFQDICRIFAKENRLRERDGKDRLSFEITMG